MHGFVLKIFFSGLIVFLPNSDGKELTVLLVNTPAHYALADGAALAHHRALVVARAGLCEGCTADDDASIAQFLFGSQNQTPAQALKSFHQAIAGGGAWELSGSDLTLIGPSGPLAIRNGARAKKHAVPADAAEREDFSWIASLKNIAPSAGGLKAGLTGKQVPPPGLIAARLTLNSGKVFTYSVIRVGGKVRPIHFRKPSGKGPEAAYAQAMANWVEADIQVPGEVVELKETSFTDPKQTRSMKLHPQNGVVELAVLNLPPFQAPPRDAEPPVPTAGQHFQVFYDLVRKPPAPAERLVPHVAAEPAASDPEAEWAPLHPKAVMWSDLLEFLNMAPRGKGPYDLTLCPMLQP